MKVFLSLLIIGALCSCSNKLTSVKTELIGCWELITVDGVKYPTMIHYVKYNDSEVYVYWGSKTDRGLLVDRSEIRYDLELDNNENVLLKTYSEMDTTISKISLGENSTLECVLKSKRTWQYKKITQEKLDGIISAALAQDEY